MSREICIPYKYYFGYKKITRTNDQIKRQINQIYKKYQEVLKNGYKPTHIFVNDLDYQFIKAYFHYNLDLYISSGFRSKCDIIYGLKVIVTKSKRLTVGWEP